MSNLRTLLELSEPDFTKVVVECSRLALGHYRRGVVRELPTRADFPLRDRRSECAAILRNIRRLQKTARGLSRPFRVTRSMFAGMDTARNTSWWRWVDDRSLRRSPCDYSAAAREERTVELLARVLDGSIFRCALGECPPFPCCSVIDKARQLLAAAGE